MGESQGETAEPAQGKGSAVAGAQEESPKENSAPGAPGAEAGGEIKPEKAASAAASAATPAHGEGEPAKEQPAAVKAENGGKNAAKAKKSPAAKQPAKEKAPAAAKDGGKKPTKAEKNTMVTKAQDGGKETAKEKATAPAKEKATDAQKPPAAAEAEDGGQEPTEEALAAAGAQGEVEKEANTEQTNKEQPLRGPEPTRPALMQSLSCPATCQRYPVLTLWDGVLLGWGPSWGRVGGWAQGDAHLPLLLAERSSSGWRWLRWRQSQRKPLWHQQERVWWSPAQPRGICSPQSSPSLWAAPPSHRRGHCLVPRSSPSSGQSPLGTQSSRALGPRGSQLQWWQSHHPAPTSPPILGRKTILRF